MYEPKTLIRKTSKVGQSLQLHLCRVAISLCCRSPWLVSSYIFTPQWLHLLSSNIFSKQFYANGLKAVHTCNTAQPHAANCLLKVLDERRCTAVEVAWGYESWRTTAQTDDNSAQVQLQRLSNFAGFLDDSLWLIHMHKTDWNESTPE